MTLDIPPLTSAIQRLDEGMERYLESVSPTPGEFDRADFPDLIRSANERGLLLGDWPRRKQYRDMRAKTSHTCDEDIALVVVAGIPAFQQEAHHLHDQILARLT